MPNYSDKLTMRSPDTTYDLVLDRDKLVAGLSHRIHETVLAYAGRGLRVFPCGKDKKPLVSGGFKSATIELAQIESWWAKWPNASIGSPTGKEAGFWVLDIDQPTGPKTLANLERIHDKLPFTREQRTGGGGRQLFFKWIDGREIRNNAGTKLGLNIDVRGEGGYVILPPSGHPSGGTYQWLTTPEEIIAEAPAWLLDMVYTNPTPPRTESRGMLPTFCASHVWHEETCASYSPVQPTAWAQSAFEQEVLAVTEAHQGNRNATLFKAAAALGELVAGCALDRREVEQTLQGAALAVGLEAKEANKTISSGLETGRRTPRFGPPSISTGGADRGHSGEALDKPTLVVRPGELVRLADEAECVMIKADVPIYQRGGQLVRIAQLPEPSVEGGVTREAGSTIIKNVTSNWLLDSLGRQAHFVKPRRGDGPLVSVDPSLPLAQALLARAGSWNFKALRGILPGPCLRADGSIINAIGYDKRTGYYLAEPLTMNIPDHPTHDDAEKGFALLLGLLNEFPFTSEIDKAVALALLLTPLARSAVGRMPLLLVSAPVRGSGKSTLVRLAAVLATGRPAPVIAATASGDELEKRLIASLLAGDGLILLDNFNGTLRSDLLSQAVTEGILRIRPLGVSEQVEIVSDSLWIANGNGLSIGGDLSRRALRCTLDPRLERPELRRFKGDPVREAQTRRSELVGAALTLMKAFIMAGKPGIGEMQPWAGFDGWSSLVRGTLVWLGMPDPLASADQLQADDPDREVLADLLAAWKKCVGSSEMTARELLTIFTGSTTATSTLSEVLGEIIGHEMRGGEAQRLGRWLTANATRVVDGLRLEKAGTSGGSSRWRVRAIEDI